MKKHSGVKRSAFPKSKKAWYSVIVSDEFTDDEVDEILRTARDCVLD